MPVTWLITGTSRGIGLEFVRQLSKDSVNVVIATCRNPSSAVDLQAILKDPQTVAAVHIIPLDTIDETGISNAAQEVERIVGPDGIDYLINNAAIGGNHDTANTLNAESLFPFINTNVLGPAMVTQAFLPLIERSSFKVLVNMSSGLASIGLDVGAKAASYSISKTALNMLTYKFKVQNPNVIFICMDPGWVKTDMGGEGALLEPEFSVDSMLHVLESLKQEDSGSFFRYDGNKVPW